MRTRVIAALLVALSGHSTTAQSKDPPTTGDLLGDARQIITSDKGDLRLWGHAPRVMVITTDPGALAGLIAVRDRIEREVASPFGPTFFGSWEVVTPRADFAAGSSYIELAYVRGGPAERQISVDLGPEARGKADIVIAIADRATMAVLNSLWSLDSRRSQSMVEGRDFTCFYSSVSYQGRRTAAYIAIVPEQEGDSIAECFWEELLHTLGPLIDADGSPFFSFDEERHSTEAKRANDIALVRALYESGAKPGEAPEAALAFLADLLGLN